MIRSDFVSNSSSSSFVLKTKKNLFDKCEYNQFLKFFTTGQKLDEYNVDEFVHCIARNRVWSIFEFEFLMDKNDEGLYTKYFDIPPMECLDITIGETFEDIFKNIFKDEEGGFGSDSCFFHHEDFVFAHRGIAVLDRKSVEYTLEILNMIKKEGWSFEIGDPKCCIIKNSLDMVKVKTKDGKDTLEAKRYKSIEEAEKFLEKIDQDLLDHNNYYVIAMSYSGNSYEDGKLWYDRDWRDNEKSCYELIKENEFGETFFVDW